MLGGGLVLVDANTHFVCSNYADQVFIEEVQRFPPSRARILLPSQALRAIRPSLAFTLAYLTFEVVPK